LETTIIGSVTSTQLGSIGNKQYGFIDIKTDSEEVKKVKIAAYTICERNALNIGSYVRAVGEPLGANGVWIAKRVLLTAQS
jgi:hypothetical protein